MSKEEILSQFREAIKGPGNRYIEEWRRQGRGVMGYFCTFAPVELFSAAGLLPVRIRGAGSKDSGPADAYLSARLCTFIRHATALALDERYSFLDGQVSLNTCDHVRRANDVWKKKSGIGFHGFISVPRVARESLYPYYREEIQNLKSKLEKHFQVHVSADDLRQAIRLHNEARRRLIRLNELRAEEPSRLSGEDALTAAVACQVMPREEFIALADALSGEIEHAEPDPPSRARVVVIGGELDEPGFLRIVESQGARVVGDNVCFGARSFEDLVPETGDPLETICRFYFFKTGCARMVGGFPFRLEAVQRLMHTSRADGVIFQRMKFCDPWGVDAHNLIQRFKNMGRPILVLEREYGVSAAGQIKTRVQAFLEALGK